MHVHVSIGHICIFFLFYKHEILSSHNILLFYHPYSCSWSSAGSFILSIPFTYFLPSWLLWAFGLTHLSRSVDPPL